jgi:O-acetyl-ADP-ribose deacetylase (regulator of RNase III)
MLEIADYRHLIQLDHPFISPPPARDADEVLALVERLLASPRLTARGLSNMPWSSREQLYARLISANPLTLSTTELEQTDMLLAYEQGQRPRASLASIAWRWRHNEFAGTVGLWRGDITTLEVDAIVNAANSQMLGCFQPFHRCIDNVIHAAAGPRLRDDCARIMLVQKEPEETGLAKITRAYHLPARFVLHTVGPIYHRSEHHEQYAALLAQCYRHSLTTAAAIPSIQSLAFCCISTGVFAFPNVAAAAIAIETVTSWFKQHPACLIQVIFNVFLEQDWRIYQHALEGMNDYVHF